MDYRDLMLLHIQALFTQDVTGDLVQVNEPAGAPAPRLFVGRTPHDAVVRFRHDVDRDIRERLAAVVQDDLSRARAFDVPLDPSPYADILGYSAPVQRVWSGPVFYCRPERQSPHEIARITQANAHVLHAHLPEWASVVSCRQPMMALLVDGDAVSVCCSVRLTSRTHEAGVETAPRYRGRGYAADVVTAWAREVCAQNRVPLYSTSWSNKASLTVARKLGLDFFGNDLHLT